MWLFPEELLTTEGVHPIRTKRTFSGLTRFLTFATQKWRYLLPRPVRLAFYLVKKER